jgi:hypothetical protein
MIDFLLFLQKIYLQKCTTPPRDTDKGIRKQTEAVVLDNCGNLIPGGESGGH